MSHKHSALLHKISIIKKIQAEAMIVKQEILIFIHLHNDELFKIYCNLRTSVAHCCSPHFSNVILQILDNCVSKGSCM